MLWSPRCGRSSSTAIIPPPPGVDDPLPLSSVFPLTSELQSLQMPESPLQATAHLYSVKGERPVMLKFRFWPEWIEKKSGTLTQRQMSSWASTEPWGSSGCYKTIRDFSSYLSNKTFNFTVHLTSYLKGAQLLNPVSLNQDWVSNKWLQLNQEMPKKNWNSDYCTWIENPNTPSHLGYLCSTPKPQFKNLCFLFWAARVPGRQSKTLC